MKPDSLTAQALVLVFLPTVLIQVMLESDAPLSVCLYINALAVVNFKLVTCLHLVVCSDGEVRLSGGLTDTEGRIEVCIDEIWGTVCNDMLDSADTGVICAQLGYSRYSKQSVFNFRQHRRSVIFHRFHCCVQWKVRSRRRTNLHQ